ncbi:MAG TPA: response regulator transcription factor [Chitinophagaceae bacterium]|jgi:DNA-binding NarL/FixJ family response regulator
MRILIVDDHAVIRRGLIQILLGEFPSATIGECKDAEDAIVKTMKGEWDIIICDLAMPGQSGLEVVQHVKRNFSKTPVLILSIHPERLYAVRALKAGAAGYMSKDAAPEELVNAVHRLLLGRKYISAALADQMADALNDGNIDKEPHESLSQREFDIFQLIALGKPVSKIAEQLNISINTVSTHRAKILQKMNMAMNADLTRYALEKKLI